MTPGDDIPVLRERLGDRLRFNGMINKKTADEPDEAAYRALDQFLREGVEIIKFWAAPRGRDRGLTVDAPWRIECARRAVAAGIRIFMVHVGDPDVWFRTMYTDAAKFGTKPDQYVGLERMMQMFPESAWIGAHMGGDPEHPDHLEALLEKYPNYYVDTSATKWQVREVSPRAEAIRALICRHPTRFLFGVDLVTRHQPDARALRQPLLVPAHAVGERLAGPQPDRRPGLHGRRRASHRRRCCAGSACRRTCWSRSITTTRGGCCGLVNHGRRIRLMGGRRTCEGVHERLVASLPQLRP